MTSVLLGEWITFEDVDEQSNLSHEIVLECEQIDSSDGNDDEWNCVKINLVSSRSCQIFSNNSIDFANINSTTFLDNMIGHLYCRSLPEVQSNCKEFVNSYKHNRVNREDLLYQIYPEIIKMAMELNELITDPKYPLLLMTKTKHDKSVLKNNKVDINNYFAIMRGLTGYHYCDIPGKILSGAIFTSKNSRFAYCRLQIRWAVCYALYMSFHDKSRLFLYESKNVSTPDIITKFWGFSPMQSKLPD